MRHQILVRSFVLVVAIVVAGSQAAAEGQGRDRGSQERDGGSEGQDRGSRQGAAAGLILVQAQQTCGVLHLDLGTTTLNALGLTITTSPITLDISGNSGGVLGNLVCQALGLLNSVVNLAGVLNQLLGVLGGGLGGLTGGLA